MCLICYQSFSQNCELKKQVDLIHKNKHPRNCRICDKRFSHKGASIYDVRWFWAIFDLPTYPNQMIYYITLFSKIRWSLTYLPTLKSDVICGCSLSVTKNLFEKFMRLEQLQKSIKAQVAIIVVLKKIESNLHTLITSWNSKSSKCLICYQSFSQKCEFKRHIDLIIIIKDSHNSRICYKSFSHKLQLGLLLFSNGCSISWTFSTCF